MTDKKEQAKIQAGKTAQEKKPSEEELQQWLEAVHFGSCCSDPLISGDDQKSKEACNIEKKSANKQK